jgi:hypothetical protein
MNRTFCKFAVILGFCARGWAQEWTPSRPQDNVLFINANQEHRTCVVPRSWTDALRQCPVAAAYTISIESNRRIILQGPDRTRSNERLLDEDYFIQGHRIELEVVNRRFLTDYSISIDGVTQMQTGPNIRNLNEAENLTLGTATFATIPPSKGGAEGLQARTATQILLQLIDDTTSGQPITDMDSDQSVIEREREKVRAQIDDFDRQYIRTLGTAPPLTWDAQCMETIGEPSIIPLRYCLDDESRRDAHALSSEQAFRDANTRVQDLITAVMALGTQLSSTDLPNKLTALVNAIAQYENDVNVFAGNIQAAADAAELAQIGGDFRRRLRREEMKVLLLGKLKGLDSKPTLDDTELNHLLDSYYDESLVGGLGNATLRRNIATLQGRVNTLRPAAREPISRVNDFRARLAAFRNRMSGDLPNAISDLNKSQGLLLGLINQIYDRSTVSTPLAKQIDLSGHSGNLIVYFTVRRIENFQRYTVVQVQGPGTSAQTNPNIVALPQATAPTAPAPSQSTGNASASTTSNSSTTANGTSVAGITSTSVQTDTGNAQGIVVAKGVFQVHDVFHANVVAAVAFSTLKDQSVAQQAQPQSCTGTAVSPDPNCFSPVVSDSHKWAPVVGLDYYFQPRDTFPRMDRPWLCREHLAQCFGVMGAASVVKANDYFLGGFFEPALGVQFGVGANFGLHTVLQSPYKPGTPVDISGTFPTTEQRGTGLFLSAGLDLGIFRKIFGKFSGIGTSASGTSGQ